MRTLVVGWFSFEQMGATAGDLLSRDVVCRWLTEAGRPFDMAVAAPFTGGIDWREADPLRYDELLFVCGPFGNGPPITGLLERFAHCRHVGVNLSMLQPLEEWNPFDLLLERDSSRTARPDLSFLAEPTAVPVIGLVLVHPQQEYGERGRHAEADQAIDALLASREAAVVPIDTRLDENATGLRTAAEVAALVGRMDAVVTTRLHGTVLALKAGVPVLAVDPIAGGAKVSRQALSLDWPAVFGVDQLRHADLAAALDWCLTSEARLRAEACAARAAGNLLDVRRSLEELHRD